ncbi:DUF4309 domain-containing protein [Desulfosporosinus shakirovi]|nr:DUF4309 domain-containing protein [Desulfosporosinus sp. SRJS8]MCB8816157.1 YjgB family protein [Desulfosporosinus sp. SRJS8]
MRFAKGYYDTYSSHYTVFGMNKGSQIFEIRLYDSGKANIAQ